MHADDCTQLPAADGVTRTVTVAPPRPDAAKVTPNSLPVGQSPGDEGVWLVPTGSAAAISAATD